MPPGQVWAISPGTQESGAGLYRIEVTVGPGNGAVKILNTPAPSGFRESVKVGEQNLYTRAKELVGDRDPRGHEGREDPHHRDGENDRYQNETVPYHFHSTLRVFYRPGAPPR